MDRIDRLLNKAKLQLTICEQLAIHNPYIGKTDTELLDYLSGENYRAPEMHTTAWDKFMYALIHSRTTGGLKSVRGDIDG